MSPQLAKLSLKVSPVARNIAGIVAVCRASIKMGYGRMNPITRQSGEQITFLTVIHVEPCAVGIENLTRVQELPARGSRFRAQQAHPIGDDDKRCADVRKDGHPERCQAD